MIDIHSHILPGLDDGAADIEDSLAMLSLAAEGGTEIMAATPHSYYLDRTHPGRQKETVLEAFSLLQKEVEKSGINIKIVCGTEIFGERDTAERLKDGRLLTLNGTNHPLVEFDFEEEEDFIFSLMEQLLEEGYSPVMAHPERYRCFYENPAALYELCKMGIVLQINKGSVFGQFGRRVQIVADIMLRHRLAGIAASDSHDIRVRTPGFLRLAEFLDAHYGEGCSPLLLYENPKRILEGREAVFDSPVPFF